MSKVHNLTDGRTKLIIVSNYAAFYSGNFIALFTALEKTATQRDMAVSYVFPKRAPFANWGENGKYADNHTILTSAFEPNALAVTIKEMVRSVRSQESEGKTSGRAHAPIIIHMNFLDWKAIGAVTLALKHEHCTLVIQEHMRVAFGRRQAHRSLLRCGKDFLKKLLYRYVTAGCKVIGVSDAVYQDLVEIRGAKSTYMVRNAIDINHLDGQWSNALQLDPEHDAVIFGTHFETKGVDIALRAIMKTRCGLRLVVLTHDEEDAAERLDRVDNEWHKFAVVKHVVKDVACAFDHALCFISPSRHEAFGYAVAEAAYCNTQVIASDVPGLNSMKCVPGIQWVHTEDADDLARAMINCYEMRKYHQKEIEEQKKRQKACVRACFDVQKWCEEILKVYDMEE